jgi:isopentenyl-diphosphate delta-isomerase
VRAKDGPLDNGLKDLKLMNNSIPELDMEEIDLGLELLGKEISFPIVINAITGGVPEAYQINYNLAQLAAKYRLPMAVGSQVVAIDDPKQVKSFSIVREVNPDGVVFANVSAGTQVDKALKAVEMVSADALQLHFNLPQELAMPEGERSFKGIAKNIREIIDNCPVPVIAKEVGFGFTRETVKKLFDLGVTWFDNSGSGGTNFIGIENRRGGDFAELADWGLPTAVSLLEVLSLSLPVTVIASGGIRTAQDIAKCISAGADLVGMAGSLLKKLQWEGYDALDKHMARLTFQFKAVCMMTGSSNLQELRKQPLIILGQTAEWMRCRGIEPGKWANR